MYNIICKIGFIIFSLGLCTADSENLLIPISLITLGLIMIKLTYKNV